MKTRTLVLIGAAVFIVSLVLSAPVGLLYAKLVRNPGASAVQFAGLDGSLAEGRASGVLLRGQPLLAGLHWRLRPLALLLARAAFAIDASGELTLEGKAAKRLTGGLDLDDIRAAGPLRRLLLISGDNGVPVDGQFGLKLDRARLRQGFVSRIDGEVTISGLKWTLARDPVVLGDFIARVATIGDLITAKVEPLSGPLDVGGEIRVKTDRSYEIDLQVKAKPEADPLVQNLVRSLGQADTQGFFHVRSAGSLGAASPAS